MNITAKKILSLDSNYSSMGLSSLTCRIFDKNDSKRFDLYIIKKQYSLAKILIGFLVASIAVQYLVLIVFEGSLSMSFYFDTPLPYIFTFVVIPLVATTSHQNTKEVSFFLKLIAIFALVVKLVLNLIDSRTIQFGYLSLERIYSGPIVIDFMWNAGFFIINFLLSFLHFLKKFFIDDHEVTIEEMEYLTIQLELRLHLCLLVLNCFYVLQK